MTKAAEILELDDGGRLAIRHRPGAEPGVLFCPGFHSNMLGEKALALDAWCKASGRQMTLFDYFGHGESGGSIEKGRIGRCAADTITVLDRVTRGRQLQIDRHSARGETEAAIGRAHGSDHRRRSG